MNKKYAAKLNEAFTRALDGKLREALEEELALRALRNLMGDEDRWAAEWIADKLKEEGFAYKLFGPEIKEDE
jgi:hypothetical protein